MRSAQKGIEQWENEPSAKAILPELRSVQKAISYQFYNPEAAGHLQARNIAKEYGYTSQYNPTSGKLLDSMRNPGADEMKPLINEIKAACGHIVGIT